MFVLYCVSVPCGFIGRCERFGAVLLTDIFSVAAVAATVGLWWLLCINHTKKAVNFKYTFKLYQYFSHLGISVCYRHKSRL
jgi:hypothetical protein